jgi:uncharacterized ferritin-like protein (DUF455 family)
MSSEIRIESPGPAGATPATELRAAALELCRVCDPWAKAQATRALAEAFGSGAVALACQTVLAEPGDLPGRPPRPELVDPRLLERRSMHTAAGRAVLLHALAHIEFNAINLALDALWRFAGMPTTYYADWLRVAAEEAHHFSLLSAHLVKLGYVYGDFTAHDGLWEMARKTAGDVLARMALVPRTLEARGLDASAPIRARLAQAGDQAAAEILDVILRDEIGHVLIGNRWFRYVCEARGLDPHTAYSRLAQQYDAPRLKGPFNFEARRAAGFDAFELAALENASR